MTIEKKKLAIRQHCRKHWESEHSCEGCPLYAHISTSCSGEDADIDGNYNLMVGLQKIQPEHDGCVGCKHELKDDDELPCSHCRGTLLANNPLYKVCPDLYEPEVLDNPYWERINAIAEKQRAKGVNKYGVGLESNPAAIFERINHLQEELIDALMYCEWIKEHLND